MGPSEPERCCFACTRKPSWYRARRLADGWLVSPEPTFEQANTAIAYYRARCAAHKRTPTAIAIRRDIYVGQSAAEAERTARAVVDRGYRGIEPSALVWGDVAAVTEKFRRLGTRGYTDVIVRHLVDDQAKIIGTLARLAG